MGQTQRGRGGGIEDVDMGGVGVGGWGDKFDGIINR